MAGTSKIRVAVLGASGYTGTELVKALATHPAVTISLLGGSGSSGKNLWEIDPSVKDLNLPLLESVEVSEAAKRADFFFLALPHTQSMNWVPTLLSEGKKVVDLSGDFRLQDILAYEKFYKVTHTAKDLVGKAVYGLPELNRNAIAGASFVANPGCYPTVSALALLPLVAEKGLIEDASIIIDAKSGFSGAGRQVAAGEAREKIRDNFSVYKAGGVHQHIPEIEQSISIAAQRPLTVCFTPHLLELERGILATVYVKLAKATNLASLRNLFEARYRDEPFVHIEAEGKFPDLKQVRGTNDCRLGLVLDERTNRVIVVGAEDNLGKGAALQAVQNMNLMLGLSETTGLSHLMKGDL